MFNHLNICSACQILKKEIYKVIIIIIIVFILAMIDPYTWRNSLAQTSTRLEQIILSLSKTQTLLKLCKYLISSIVLHVFSNFFHFHNF